MNQIKRELIFSTIKRQYKKKTKDVKGTGSKFKQRNEHSKTNIYQIKNPKFQTDQNSLLKTKKIEIKQYPTTQTKKDQHKFDLYLSINDPNMTLNQKDKLAKNHNLEIDQKHILKGKNKKNNKKIFPDQNTLTQTKKTRGEKEDGSLESALKNIMLNTNKINSTLNTNLKNFSNDPLDQKKSIPLLDFQKRFNSKIETRVKSNLLILTKKDRQTNREIKIDDRMVPNKKVFDRSLSDLINNISKNSQKTTLSEVQIYDSNLENNSYNTNSSLSDNWPYSLNILNQNKWTQQQKMGTPLNNVTEIQFKKMNKPNNDLINNFLVIHSTAMDQKKIPSKRNHILTSENKINFNNNLNFPFGSSLNRFFNHKTN
ncbi:hypothetical protein M0812_14687 [Anaeramoeba flamelloides]|uniref:Uncharacterized protein n=1 Tax=Anaeramoeba flamelloides TaxID=1746091 RepID=A0AAV7Z9F3_9EUKA|nr:hypothetical protein M0812_14687 [Anaeramoeba flamelloides]